MHRMHRIIADPDTAPLRFRPGGESTERVHRTRRTVQTKAHTRTTPIQHAVSLVAGSSPRQIPQSTSISGTAACACHGKRVLGGRYRMHAAVPDHKPALAVVPAVRAHSLSHPITSPARRRHVLRPSDPVYILDYRSHQLQSQPIPEHEAPLRLHCCKQLSLRSMHPKLARSQASPIPRWPVSQPLPLPSPDGVPRMLSVVPRVLVFALATTQPARWSNAGAKGTRGHGAIRGLRGP